ncbi:hypothetical protein [Flavobacterium sp.]|uniref:hypothetical protein n=1 Tax=Flavobacterium sp. TaxID=239 RepID=UPI0025BBCC3A|nr:hypothetical protein [Flavobacterium sp.]MBA4155284.1 hypothetical protein [Flavobacterium sp.]
MKKSKLIFGISILVIGFTSCKDEKNDQAEKTVETYVVYVDSVETISAEEAKTNWAVIETNYQARNAAAQEALADLKDKEVAQAKIDASNAKYEALKAKLEAANQAAAVSPKQQLRNTLFGEGKIGDDMSFSWVNKDNLLTTFKTFTETVQNNKDAYTREDWDEIKLLYEALGTRKNTVEKEGLSSSDNNEIAGIKIKFAPMLKVNRMGAKAEENAAAKE